MTRHSGFFRRARAPGIIMLVGLLAMQAKPAAAHAVLMQSSPADGATVPAAHADVVLRYNSRIDAARSRVTLDGPNQQNTRLSLLAPQSDSLSSAADLVPGAYVLHWQVLAVDGHITRGEVRFSVAD